MYTIMLPRSGVPGILAFYYTAPSYRHSRRCQQKPSQIGSKSELEYLENFSR